jgi:serine/threonine-protein kinase
MDKYLGKRIDKRYEIQELLGVGGMARVYKAYDQVSEKIVTVKILKDEFLTNGDFIDRFKNESKAVSVLSHPNIVKVEGVSFGDQIQYIVMEYIDGITLKDYIRKKKRLSWQEAAGFAVSILHALSHAHEKGVVHRDIKPQNMMISMANRIIKVTDFGIASFIDPDQKSKTIIEKTIGSVHYISPEQAKGAPVSEKSDIYSIGVMLYEMLTGKPPFEGESAVSVALMQVQKEPKSPRNLCENIPFGLEEITLKAMKKDPNQRFFSAKGMLSALKEVQGNPDVRFNYFYDTNDDTKYINPVDVTKNPSEQKEDYNDNYVFDPRKHKEVRNKKRWTQLVFALGGVFVLALLSLGAWAISSQLSSNRSKDVTVPNFIGKKVSEVISNKTYKFNFVTESVYDPDKPEDVIVDQEPRAGSKKVKEGAKIILKVSMAKKKVKIPDLKGLDSETAKSKLKALDLSYETALVDSEDVSAGNVVKTDPVSESEVETKTKVTLFLSKGISAKKIRVPNVIGMDKEDATDKIILEGLKVSGIEKQKSDKPLNSVISISPAVGIEVSKDTYVKLIISEGPQKPVEVTYSLNVNLPNVDKEVQISVYIDGVADDSNSKRVKLNYTPSYLVLVKGTQGKKQVSVDIDGKTYRTYEVDFDNSNYKVTASYPYSP